MLEIIIILLLAIFGAVIYRARGMSATYNYLPRPLPQALYASIYVYLTYLYTDNLWILGGVLVATTLLLTKGHGRVMNYGPNEDDVEFEDLTFPIWWLDGKVKPIVYDFIGQSLVGLWYTLPAGIAVGYFSPIAGTLIALSGATKGVAYLIGHKVGRNTDRFHHIATPTRIGELLTGFFGWSLAAILLVI